MAAKHGCKAAATYEAYISANLGYLKAKCSKLTDCIERLFEESSLSILRGESISLTKSCGLMYKPANDNYTTLPGKCSPVERDEIRSDLERDFNLQLTDENNSWSTVSTCLTNKYGHDQRTTRVEEICLLVRNKTELCDKSTNKLVEDFVSEEITSLHCMCKNLIKSFKWPLGMTIGIGIGCFVVLVTIFGLVFFCYRRGQKRKTKKPTQNVVYVTRDSDTHVYQEVSGERVHASFQQSHPDKNLGRNNQSMMSGMKYRPMPPVPQQAPLMGYEQPPRYSQCDLDDDDGYFKPIPDPVKATGGSCADTVAGFAPVGDGSAVASALNDSIDLGDGSGSSSVPFVEASTQFSAPLGPVPAKRTKKEDRKVESHYFTLEDGKNKGRNDAETIIEG